MMIVSHLWRKYVVAYDVLMLMRYNASIWLNHDVGVAWSLLLFTML